MGNLGWYQLMTSFAKKVGGPKVMIAIVAAGGYGVLRIGEAGVNRAVKASKAAIKKRSIPCGATGKLFTVVSDGQDSGGLDLRTGDEYRVLGCDAESILIEVLKDANNPYYVSSDFLKSVSDFEIEGDTGDK